MNEPTKKYITLAEAVKITGRKYEALRRDITCGRLRASQIAGKGPYYIKPEDLDRHFEQHVVNNLAGRVI